MRVLVAAVSTPSCLSGVQRHALNLIQSLLTQGGITAIDLVLATWQRDMVSLAGLTNDERLTIHYASVTPGAISRNRWYFCELPRFATYLASEVVHLTYPVPLQKTAFGCPVVVTLHDLYPHQIPANFGFYKAMFNLLILQQCLRAVDAIASVSESTHRSLQRYVPDAVSRRALRIYNSLEPAAESSHVAPWTDTSPFLLCVAQHRRNKNLVFLLRIFAGLLSSGQIDPRMRLVIIGIDGPETAAIRKMLDQEDLADQVTLLEGVTEQVLHWCYRHCRLVVAPSITEGFGLPVVEALLSGAPVVCSDIPAFREFGGSHCRYVALGKDASREFADAIVAVLKEPRKPPMQIPQLSARVIGGEYFHLYSRLLCARRCDESFLISSPAELRTASETRKDLT